MYTQADVDASVTMGYNDAVASSQQPADANLTLKYFGLKRKNDKRIRGVSFEKFLELDKSGHFADFEVLADKKLETLFSQ